MKKKVWNYHIHPFPKSCARNNAKPFAFFTFGSSSFFWIFWYIIHGGRLIITWVNCIVLYLERVSRGHGDKSINQWMKILTKSWVDKELVVSGHCYAWHRWVLFTYLNVIIWLSLKIKNHATGSFVYQIPSNKL